jgi:UDP-2,4-diacetamido-2,4,6-trideoxy-beta-L-altropyranose hydrolase
MTHSSEERPWLFIRADASSVIGTGHVMRGLALAQAWIDEGGCVRFICAELPQKLEDRLRCESCEVRIIQATPGSLEDAAQTLAAIKTGNQPPWLVIDGYCFERNYQQMIREAGFRVLLIDDYNHLTEYECDILLNQNIAAEEYGYRVSAGARVLAGTKYALLRKEFGNALSSNRKRKDDELPQVGVNVLVTMGGSDPHRMTEKVLQGFQGLNTYNLHIKAVYGAASCANEALLSMLKDAQHDCEILCNVEDMPALMQWADIAVSAAGSTCWELMAMGVPMIVFILANNQEKIAETLHERGVAVSLGWHDDWSLNGFSEAVETLCHDQKKRIQMRQTGMKLSDGQGVSRVIHHMRVPDISLRRVTMADAGLLLAWANDQLTREMSFSSGTIDDETHRNWLAQRLSNAENMLFIAQDRDHHPVGHVRLEPDHEDNYVISINMAPAERGGGLSSHILSLALREMNRLRPGASVFALIKPGNLQSVRAFKGVGFRYQGLRAVCEKDAISMVWEPLTP